ncbi:protein of unknown function [Tenacibaculum aestuariivivum]
METKIINQITKHLIITIFIIYPLEYQKDFLLHFFIKNVKNNIIHTTSLTL